MENLIEKFSGKYHISPDAVMNIVSGNAYIVFSRIISYPKKAFFQGEISMSQKILSKLTGLNERTIHKALCELSDLNLLTFNCKFKSNTLFYINWEEIYKLGVFCSSISYFGLAELRTLCNKNKRYLSFSSLDKNTTDAIFERYKYDARNDKNAQNTAVENGNMHRIQQFNSGSYNTTQNTADADITLHKIQQFNAGSGNNAQNTAVGETIPKIQQFDNITAQNTADENDNMHRIQQFKDGKNETDVLFTNTAQNTAVDDNYMLKIQQFVQNELKSAVFCAKTAQNTAVACNPSSHFIQKNDEKYVLKVILSDAESIIFDEHDVSVELVKNKSAVFCANSDESAVFCAETAVFSTQSAVQCTNSKYNIYNKYNNNYNNNYNKGGKEEMTSKKETIDNSVLSGKNQSFTSGDSANLSFVDEPSSFLEKDNSQDEIGSFIQQNEIEIETDRFNNDINKFIQLRKSDKYLSYENFEFVDIIKHPSEHKLPEERLIQEVWRELENDMEENETDRIDAWFFIKEILMRVYYDLKEENKDFQLTVQEAYSIFGFDTIQNEDGEMQFIIQSSNIKNLSEKFSNSVKPKLSSIEKRHFNIAYVDSLIKIGDEHPDNLTEVFSEMDEAMFCFHNLTKDVEHMHTVQLDKVVDQVISQFEIDKKDFMDALNLKPDNYKTYFLRYDFLIAEKVIEWNKLHDQYSEVESAANESFKNEF